ncbi:MAG: O-methyltransferase [DPANN group archaeon]|nr:O-methyltransferase [DPANN group archaeon]
MDKKIDDVLKKIEKLEKSQGFGSVPRSTGQFLHMLLLATKTKQVLELGCSLGYSAIWMALAVKENRGHIYTTEIDKQRAHLAKEHFSETKLNDVITLYEKDIFEVLANWNHGEIDFVFIDAKKEDYKKYYEAVLPLLKKGGLIVADDVGKFKEQVKPFLEKVNKDLCVVSQFLDVDDGLMLIYKK